MGNAGSRQRRPAIVNCTDRADPPALALSVTKTDIEARLDGFQARLDELNENVLILALVALDDTKFNRFRNITYKKKQT